MRQAELSAGRSSPTASPLLAAALPWVGHAQTRSRGTVCGSVAHADPSAEIPLVLLALGGRSRCARAAAPPRAGGGVLHRHDGDRRADDELIDAVIIPKRRPGHGYAFREFGRRHGDFAIVACAAVSCAGPHPLAVGGVADRPVAQRLSALEGSALADALDAFAWDLDARDDMHATARYRRDAGARNGPRRHRGGAPMPRLSAERRHIA